MNGKAEMSVLKSKNSRTMGPLGSVKELALEQIKKKMLLQAADRDVRKWIPCGAEKAIMQIESSDALV